GAGVNTAILTVTAKDEFGNLISGAAVSLAGDSASTITGGADTAGDGTSTFSVSSDIAKDVNYTVTVGSTDVLTRQVITFTPAVANAGNSEVDTNVSSVVADGVSQATITVTAKDEFDNLIPNAAVVLSSTATSTISADGNTDENGTYTYTVSALNAGDINYTATISTVGITDNATVTFTPQVFSGALSTASITKDNSVADGIEVNTIQVTALDVNSNPIAGATVSFAYTILGLADCTTNSSGVCESNATITIADQYFGGVDVNGDPLFSTPAMTFVAGDLNVSHSTVETNTSTVLANGTSQATITVTAKDINDNPIENVAITLVGNPSDSNISGNGSTAADGTYTYTVSSSNVGDVNYTATVDATPITPDLTVSFTVGAADADTSTLTATPINLVADGVAQTTVTIIARDASGHLLDDANVTAIQAGSSLVSVVSNDSNGSYSYTATSIIAEDVIYGAGITGAGGISDSKTVTFTAGDANASTSTVAVIANNAFANDDANNTLRATILDTNNNPVSGETVSFSEPVGVTLSSATCTTDANGECDVNVTSALYGDYNSTVSITDGNLSDSPASYSFVAVLSTNISIDNADIISVLTSTNTNSGSIGSAGHIVSIPYTVLSAETTLKAYSISVILDSLVTSNGENDIVATLSWAEQNLSVGSGLFDANISIDDSAGNNNGLYDAVEDTNTTAAVFSFPTDDVGTEGNVTLSIVALEPHEVLGYIVIDEGSNANGSFGGANYEVKMGIESIIGVNGGGSVQDEFYDVNGTYSLGVATMSGMIGTDGGWAQFYHDGSVPFQADELYLAIDEYNHSSLDRAHTDEKVSYWIFDQDTNLAWMEVQEVASVSEVWQKVSFRNSYTSPIATCTYSLEKDNSGTEANNPAVVRLSHIETDSMYIRIQSAKVPAESVTAGAVHCIVVEEGDHVFDDRNVSAAKVNSFDTNEQGDWAASKSENVGYTQTFVSPVVLGQVMSFNENAQQWVAFYSSDGSDDTTPVAHTTTNLFVGKQIS
ncbi:hypothetical protein DRQ25_16930, partial [Candidatus Fermentibacteria bacterium]